MSLDLDTLRDVLSGVSADDLRHLAAAKEAQEPKDTAWVRLSDEAKSEGFEMLARGEKPSLGWWRRHLPRPACEPDWPPLPQTPLAIAAQTRQWLPWELIVAAIELAGEGVARDVAEDVLASLAWRH